MDYFRGDKDEYVEPFVENRLPVYDYRMSELEETIVAVASPPGGADRGIVRMSGPGVLACLAAVFKAHGPQLPADVESPTALPGTLCLDSLASPLPCEVYLWPGQKSYTGEPVAEFHTLGSPPLLDLLIDELCRAGARLAQPGEFTLRAFLSRRIDLTQAEAVLGVIDAHDQQQLDVALTQLAGGLARPLHVLRDTLLDLLGHLEAGFDFADEDLLFIEPEELQRQLAFAAEITDKLARQISTRATPDQLPRVALVGWPNTGKSSLFNALCSADFSCETLSEKSKAIVSHHAGTTRDYLTAKIDLGGVSCSLIDTAGIDVQNAVSSAAITSPDVDRESQEIAVKQALEAQVRILCLDSTRGPNSWEESRLAECQEPGETHRSVQQQVVVCTKVDMAEGLHEAHMRPSTSIATSSITGQGIDELRRRLREAVLAAVASSSAVVAPTAVRCRESIRLASASLDHAREIVQAHIDTSRGDKDLMIAGEELIAAELRVALDELGKVVGTIYTDDILDHIFSRFCVGK